MAASHTLVSPRGDFSEDLEEVCDDWVPKIFFPAFFFLLTIKICVIFMCVYVNCFVSCFFFVCFLYNFLLKLGAY